GAPYFPKRLAELLLGKGRLTPAGAPFPALFRDVASTDSHPRPPGYPPVNLSHSLPRLPVSDDTGRPSEAFWVGLGVAGSAKVADDVCEICQPREHRRMDSDTFEQAREAGSWPGTLTRGSGGLLLPV